MITFAQPLKVVGRVDHGEELVIFAESFVTHEVRQDEVVLIGDDAFCVDANQPSGVRYLPAWKLVTGLHCPN